MCRLSPFVVALPALTALAVALPAQDPDLETKDNIKGGPPKTSPARLGAGLTEQRMWPSPTKEDWKKPVRIEFERTWGDAVAVARETNKPILVCINMDGEIASEHYAGIHYRNPETAKRFADYVCVVASVYRHTPRDHDAQGNRIPCPRFGCVTCGEHIAIEPLLLQKFMNGQRISPRHIMVELDGKEVYDVFHAWDNKSILETIDKGIAARAAQPRTIVRGDRPVLERVASRAREDRLAVEKAYRSADRPMREKLLRQAIEHPEAAPVELLRLAIFGVDEELAGLARQALVKVRSPSAVVLLGEALRVPLPEAEREALVSALEQLRTESPWARLLANVHRGLGSRSKTVNVKGWSGGSSYQAAGSVSIDNRAAARDAAVAADPNNAMAKLDLAESSLELALDPSTAKRYWGTGKNRYGRLMVEDAKRLAAEARKDGAKGWRIDAVDALCEYYVGDHRRSHELAIQAATAMPAKPDSLVAVSTLALFAEARVAAIWDAVRNKKDWPGEWMTDVSSAYTVLARHPLGNAVHALEHYDFLERLGAKRRAERVLTQALERFPAAPDLHDRLRRRLLLYEGLPALQKRYKAMIAAKPDAIALVWFAGYAAIVEAEYHRREKRATDAADAYRRAITLFDQSVERAANFKPNSDLYAARALSGLARLAIERGDLDQALVHCLAGIERSPEATPIVDGLEISPVQTARLLESRLLAADRGADQKRLQGVLDSLDPELLKLPDYEQGRRSQSPGRRRGRRRR